MPYALITGASKGIGRAIAETLAGRGFDVLLVARSEKLLQDVSDHIQTNYKVNAHYLAMDLAVQGAAEKIYTWCITNNYEVHILVNNAGYGLSGPFEKYSLAETTDMMLLNMLTPVQLCKLFLPSLRTYPKAYILNIASTAAYQAIPLLSVYAGTKSFVLLFSRGLRRELRNTNVSVTCISPGATDTDFVVRAQVGEKGLKTADKVNMTPAAVAAIAVHAMLSGKAEIIPGLINKIGAFMTRLLPKGPVETIAMKLYE
jgi:short-subunit dehydrogenase